MSMGRHLRRAGATLAALTVFGAVLAGQSSAAEASKRSLCGVAGCSRPGPRISRSRLLAAFAKAYWKGYSAGRCDRNINRLVARLHKAGANLRGFEVLYLLPTRRQHGRLVMDAGRNITAVGGRVSRVNWGFHVVLLLGDEILDLDYGRAPTVVRIGKYFRTMWAANTRRRVGVRSISAIEYLREYRSTVQRGSPLPQRNYSYYLHDKGHRYRLVPSGQYLKNP